MTGPAPFQWRRFMFFDQERFDNQQSNADSIVSQLKNFKLCGVCGGRGTLVLAIQPGFLHFVSRQYNEIALVNAFQASVMHVTGLKKHSYIIAVGKDEPSSPPVLKIWNYDKIEVGINPTLTRTLKLELDDFSCLAAHENLNYMALGFKCGKVYLYHKDIARGRHSNHRVLCDLHEEITGLVFSPLAKDIFLYITTPTQVHCYCIVGKERKVYTDPSVGCQPNQLCPVQILHPDQHMAIVCPDGVRFYGPDGMGATCSTSQDGTIFLLGWQLDYLLVATHETTASASKKDEKQSQSVLTIYDSVNKFIGFYGSFRNLAHIVAEFGAIFLFTSDGMVFRLVEKDLQSKLDLLFKKNQYELAIKLAKSQRYGDTGLVKIFKHYGDHLIGKGDFLSAAEQYRQTIGGLETSYVIRQLLTGAAPPSALACYLEGVHELKKATAPHTSLLLNCYIKMKDEVKLNAFITKFSDDVTFDADIAIRVLRSAHYYELALGLAKANHKHQQVVTIYIENLAQEKGSVDSALNYVEQLDPGSANWCIRRYGQQFMAHSPERTTNLLKLLLSTLKQEVVQTPATAMAASGVFSFDSAQVNRTSQVPSLQLFNGRPGPLMNFLESILERNPDSAPPAVYGALVEVYVQQWSAAGQVGDSGKQAMFETKILNVLRSKYGQGGESGGIDPNQTMLLMFSSHKFYPGVEFMLEQGGYYPQLMSHLADRGAYREMVELCNRQNDDGVRLRLLGQLAGSREGFALVPEVIAGFSGARSDRTSSLTLGKRNSLPVDALDDGASTRTATARGQHVLAPEVVDALCRGAGEANEVPFGYVRDYLLEELDAVNTAADTNAAISDKTRREAVELRSKLDAVRDNAVSFQESKCRSCNYRLELPTVHFMCQHSYHANCLDYGDPDCCPRCSREHKEILEQVRAFDEMRRAPSTSVNELGKVPDLFATLADLLSKGLLSGNAAAATVTTSLR